MAEFSFEDLKRVWLAEKNSRELVELKEEFYPNVARYIAGLGLESKRGEPLRRELLKEELRNALGMVHEIHLSRVLKATDEIISGGLPVSLLERERYAFGEIRQSLEKLRSELLPPAEVKEAVKMPREMKNVLIVMQADVPQMVGEDLRRFGPFKRGDVVNLPRRSGELIMKHGLARKIEVKF